MKMDGSWKKFYTERRGKYKSKFPFLKEDQITAKLRRIWYKERVSSGLTSGVQSSELAARHKASWKSRKKKPSSGGRAGFCCHVSKNELCQENVQPCLASQHNPTVQDNVEPCLASLQENHNNSDHTPSPRYRSTSSPSRQALREGRQLNYDRQEGRQLNCDRQEGRQLNSDIDTSSCSEAALKESEDGDNFLCAMFAPLPTSDATTCMSCSGGVSLASHQLATPSSDSTNSGSKYCMFLNDGDIFM